MWIIIPSTTKTYQHIYVFYVLKLIFQENKETMKDKQRAKKIEKPYQVAYIYIFVDAFQCVEKKATSWGTN